MKDKICECKHRDTEHSYDPDTDHTNLECDKCKCKVFVPKLSKEEWSLKFAKDNLKHKERVYEVYLKAYVKYAKGAYAYSAIMATELYQTELMRVMEANRKNGESLFRKMMFGDGKKLTELEQIKKEEERLDRLIRHIENRIHNMDDETKMKMAKDSIEYMDSWFGLSKYEVKNNQSQVLNKGQVQPKGSNPSRNKKSAYTDNPDTRMGKKGAKK